MTISHLMSWREIKGLGVGEALYVGKVRVARVSYSLSHRGMWNARCRLPGADYLTEEYPTKELAKTRLEGLVASWFRAAGNPLPDGVDTL